MPPAASGLLEALGRALDVARLEQRGGAWGPAETRRIRQVLSQIDVILGPAAAPAAAADADAGPSLLSLGQETLAVVLSHLSAPEDLGRLCCVSRRFHAEPQPPRPPSVIERAVCLRAERAGAAVPPGLEPGSRQTAQALLLWECQRRGAGHRIVGAGAVHSVFVDEEFRLLTCGGGGQTTNGPGDGGHHAEPSPQRLAPGQEDAEPALSPAGTCAVLGHGDEGEKPIPSPRAIATLAGVRVQTVSTSRYHVLAVTEDGDLYSFGDGENGVLGHGDEEDLCDPRRVEALAGVRISSAAAGDNHSLVVSVDGALFSFGYGARGRLGHGNEESLYEPMRVEALRHERIASASAGSFHSLVVTSDGRVFSFGRRYHGVLGQGDACSDLCIPEMIDALADVRVVRALAGLSHSLVVSDDGNVYSFGSGGRGEIGHGDREDQLWPRRIEALTDVRVVSASAGHATSVFVCQEGQVYSCGAGDHGALGHGDREDQLVPKRIDALAGVTVISASAGFSHALMAASDGRVWGTGDGQGWARGMRPRDPTVPEALDNLRVPVTPT